LFPKPAASNSRRSSAAKKLETGIFLTQNAMTPPHWNFSPR
jgi:hypothetical protein